MSKKEKNSKALSTSVKKSKVPSEIQESDLPRISVRYLLDEFLDVINFERGVLYTLKGLLLAPRKTIIDYFAFNRRKHANPLRLLLFSTAVLAFLQFYVIGDMEQFLKDNMNMGFERSNVVFTTDRDSTDAEISYVESDSISSIGVTDSLAVASPEVSDTTDVVPDTESDSSFEDLSEEEMEQRALDAQKHLMDSIARNSDILTFLFVPIWALVTRLFFRKSGFNFAEHIVIAAFLISFQNCVGIVLLPLGMWNYIIYSTIISLGMFVFTLVFWMLVFQENSARGFFKALFGFIFGYFVYIILIGIYSVYFVVHDMGIV